MTFSQLGLAAPLLKALDTEGYTTPTPIQEKAIPIVLSGSDLLGIAQTGTGKTAAFALPILHRLASDPRPAQRKGCRVLVLSPTRELASQIAESFRVYGRHLGITVAVVFGGVGIRPQITTLSRGVDVLVATPGRLLDHIGERTIALSGTEVLVLDEADQMLDLGFVKPIRRIAAQLSARRQNLFFSATMPREIAVLADELLNNPVKIAVAPVASTVDRVEQRVIHVEGSRKSGVLVELLADAATTRTLVFTRTKRGADRVAKHLTTNDIGAAAIHGNKSQSQREQALQLFKNGRIRVLVATDIAARGIDIDAVSHVINYELPEVPESYVHRIGRTARAGATGLAISFCSSDERDRLRAIERLTRQTIASEDRRGSGDAGVDLGKDDRPPLRKGQSSRGGFQRSGGQRDGQRSGGARDQRRDDRGGAPAGARAGHRGGRSADRRDNDRRDGDRPQIWSNDRPDRDDSGAARNNGGGRRQGARTDDRRGDSRDGAASQHREPRKDFGGRSGRPAHAGGDRAPTHNGARPAGNGARQGGQPQGEQPRSPGQGRPGPKRGGGRSPQRAQGTSTYRT